MKNYLLAAAGIVFAAAASSNAFAADEDPAAGLRSIARHLSHVHLSDCPAGGWRHDPVGRGGIDFRAVRAALEALEFAQPVLLEIIAPAPLQDTLASKASLESLGWSFRT